MLNTGVTIFNLGKLDLYWNSSDFGVGIKLTTEIKFLQREKTLITSSFCLKA